MADVYSDTYVYLYGGISSHTAVYLHGGISNYTTGFLHGGMIIVNHTAGFLHGGISSHTAAFLETKEPANSSISAYICQLSGDICSLAKTYCNGILRNSINIYIEGVIMARDYIWLKTSDNGVTKSKKFKVLTQDYDDGTLEKAEEINKTIGGGIDHSVGAVYKTWAPIIRVRHTETEADYGNVADLEYFFSLNNPNGIPSNDITFIDHHQSEYVIHLVGKLTKNLLSCEIEGTEAWYLYKLNFMRVQ